MVGWAGVAQIGVCEMRRVRWLLLSKSPSGIVLEGKLVDGWEVMLFASYLAVILCGHFK
jgi:hypothetical protein